MTNEIITQVRALREALDKCLVSASVRIISPTDRFEYIAEHSSEALKQTEGLLAQLEGMTVAPSEWYAQRHDNNDGDIEFHAYGPKESFVVFEGVNAKADCYLLMKAVGGILHDGG